MSVEHLRTNSDPEDGSDDAGRMESVPNYGAEDGTLDGARMDQERSCHGNLSADQVLETKDESIDSNDSFSHTPAQKPKRQRLYMPPSKSPSPAQRDGA